MSKRATNPTQTNLFDAILDRPQTQIPDYYLPSATHVLVAGSTIIQAIGFTVNSQPPAGWKRGATGFCKRSSSTNRSLWVQRCGQLWIVERSAADEVDQDEALVCAFSGYPIWTRAKVSAMLLAEYCDPLPGTAIAGRWARITS